jgi:hypothetical protein
LTFWHSAHAAGSNRLEATPSASSHDVMIVVKAITVMPLAN